MWSYIHVLLARFFTRVTSVVMWRWMEKKNHPLLLLPVCLALHMHKRDGFPINKQRKCHNCDGNSCLHLCFPLSFWVSLSRCQKSSSSWPTLKKKDTKNCIPSWHARIPVGAEHEDLEDWEREEELQEKETYIYCDRCFRSPELPCFCLWGPLLSLTPTKFSLWAFSQEKKNASITSTYSARVY